MSMWWVGTSSSGAKMSQRSARFRVKEVLRSAHPASAQVSVELFSMCVAQQL